MKNYESNITLAALIFGLMKIKENIDMVSELDSLLVDIKKES